MIQVVSIFLGFLISSPVFANSKLLEIPFSASIKKDSECTGHEEVKTIGFNLPTDSRYEFESFSLQKKYRGAVSYELKFIPDRQNVRRVEVELRAKRNPESVCFIVWFGPNSELFLDYVFRFKRHPSEQEAENTLLTDLNGAIQAINEVETAWSNGSQIHFERTLKAYDFLTPEFVASRVHESYQSYRRTVRMYHDNFTMILERAKTYPGLYQKLSALLEVTFSELKERDRKFRLWFHPILEMNQLSNVNVFDTPPKAAEEPGGSTENFVKTEYLRCIGKEPDLHALIHFSRMAQLKSRKDVRETLESTPGYFVTNLFRIHLDRTPSEQELIELSEDYLKKGRVFVETAIVKKAPKPEMDTFAD